MQQIVDFILELDKLKAVTRKTRPLGQARYENSAEHSWQIALLAASLAPYAPQPVQMPRVIEMLLVHDIGEIDTGDVLVYADHDPAARKAEEFAAVQRIFGLLPGVQAERFLALWQEFDEAQTPEARFAHAADRAMPVLLNLANQGQSWRENGVRHAQVVARIGPPIREGCPALWDYLQARLNAALAEGWFGSHSPATVRTGPAAWVAAPVALLSLAAALATSPAPAHAATEPLTVAAPGFPTAFVLDKLNARAAFLAAKATGEGSLTASKTARELQLMIGNARAALRDQADERWDKLGADEQALLRSLDKAAAVTPDPKADHGRIEDPVQLDVAAQVTRPPFSEDKPSLRKVEGATQAWHRDKGSYRVTIHSNLAAAGAMSYAVTIAGQPAPPQWLQVTPPGILQLTIPAAALADNFGDRNLVHLPVEVSGVFPSRSWKFWQSNTIALSFPFSLELLPRKPFSYTLKDSTHPTEVDPGRTLVAKGKPVLVPGCGAPRCVHDHNVCNEVPAGAKPVEAINFSDSMVADPNGGWTSAVMAMPTGFCAVFKQQSPNVARTVSFDVRYNPVNGDRKVTERKLKPLRPDKPGEAPAEVDALELGRAYVGELAADRMGYELQLKAFTGQTYSASSGSAPSSPMIKLTPPERSADNTRLQFSVQLPW
ncbi:HD domain-containing protein [Aquabacterium sp.]|uniref:HD domain-containing protein n=1 Tax=Aquabacterium sp. TaxID=1872578 RepID=UPI0037848A40